MSERFKSLAAVGIILTRKNENGEEEVLFQKRKNTGYCDGFYELAAVGHVEAFEKMTTATCREAKEEIGIDVNEEDLEFICMIQKNTNGLIYYNGYFKALKWKGTPEIKEPDKNEELRWININELPENIVDDRKEAIENMKKGIKYSEFGF